MQFTASLLVAPLVKNPPAMRETWVPSLGWEDPLEKGTATRSSMLGELHGLSSPWGRKESDATERLSLFTSLNLVQCHPSAKPAQQPQAKLKLLEAGTILQMLTGCISCAQ